VGQIQAKGMAQVKGVVVAVGQILVVVGQIHHTVELGLHH
jgi:hypothetical protein